jgi:hypothetical protein
VAVPRARAPDVDLNQLENDRIEMQRNKLLAWEELQFSSSEHSTQVLSSIINNLRIRVGKFHLRIEVPEEKDGDLILSFGILLEELRISATDFNFNFDIIDKIPSGNPKILHKLISLKNLSIYLNDKPIPSSWIVQLPIPAIRNLQKSLFASSTKEKVKTALRKSSTY